MAIAISLLLFALYGHHPDTATLAILRDAFRLPAGTDSTLYMHLGESAFRSGQRIYPQLFFADHQKFIYPPTSLFLIEAFDGLARHGVSVAIVWKAVLVAAWVGCVGLGVLFYRTQRKSASLPELAAVALLGALFLPFAEALYRGQVQLLLTLFWELSALLWVWRRPAGAGVVLALTCAFKPQLAIFLLWGALRREWRFAAAFLMTAIVILALSIGHFGLTNHLDYLPVLGYLSRHGEALWANQSMNGLLNRLLRNGDAVSWSYTVYPPYRPIIYIVSSLFSALLLAAGLVVPMILRWTRTTADYLLFGCLAVLISPISWEHHYGYFFFPLLLLLAAADRIPRQVWYVLCACVLLMANRWPPLDHRQSGIASLAGDYLFFAGILVCGLLVFFATKVARGKECECDS